MESTLRILLSAAITAVLFSPGRSCTCLPQAFSVAYYRSQAVDMPFSVVTVLSERLRPIPSEYSDDDIDDDVPTNLLAYEESELERVYTLRLLASHANCASSIETVNATTPYLAFDCGVRLTVNVTYVLPLRQFGYSQLNRCHTIIRLDALTPIQEQFLSSRQLCCNGACRCAVGKPANCTTEPCSEAEAPCAEATRCINNYCDGCSAEWFNDMNIPSCCPQV